MTVGVSGIAPSRVPQYIRSSINCTAQSASPAFSLPFFAPKAFLWNNIRSVMSSGGTWLLTKFTRGFLHVIGYFSQFELQPSPVSFVQFPSCSHLCRDSDSIPNSAFADLYDPFFQLCIVIATHISQSAEFFETSVFIKIEST